MMDEVRTEDAVELKVHPEEVGAPLAVPVVVVDDAPSSYRDWRKQRRQGKRAARMNPKTLMMLLIGAVMIAVPLRQVYELMQCQHPGHPLFYMLKTLFMLVLVGGGLGLVCHAMLAFSGNESGDDPFTRSLHNVGNGLQFTAAALTVAVGIIVAIAAFYSFCHAALALGMGIGATSLPFLAGGTMWMRALRKKQNPTT